MCVCGGGGGGGLCDSVWVQPCIYDLTDLVQMSNALKFGYTYFHI